MCKSYGTLFSTNTDQCFKPYFSYCIDIVATLKGMKNKGKAKSMAIEHHSELIEVAKSHSAIWY